MRAATLGAVRNAAPVSALHYAGFVAPVSLDQLNLVVSNVEASRAFYARLGLDFGDERDPVWAAHHVSALAGENAPPVDVDLDSETFATKWDEGWPGGAGIVLGFKVDTRQGVDELVAALAAAGATVQQHPYHPFWGAREAAGD